MEKLPLVNENVSTVQEEGPAVATITAADLSKAYNLLAKYPDVYAVKRQLHADPTIFIETCEEVLGTLVEKDRLEAAAQFLNMMEDSLEYMNAVKSGKPNVTDHEVVKRMRYGKLVENWKEIKKGNLK